MFVVKRPFKNLGNVHTVGSIIAEPTAIKRFKGKLAEGKIIEVTEHNYSEAASYFKAKYGVDIPPITKVAKTEEVKATPEVKAAPAKPNEVKAKVVVK